MFNNKPFRAVSGSVCEKLRFNSPAMIRTTNGDIIRTSRVMGHLSQDDNTVWIETANTIYFVHP